VVVLSANLDEELLRGSRRCGSCRAACPGILGIMLLDSSKKEAILQAFPCGRAEGFHRPRLRGELSKCIRCVYEGQIWANSQQIVVCGEELACFSGGAGDGRQWPSLLSKREMGLFASLAEA